MTPRTALALLLALAAAPARRQERPSEEDIFGKPAAPRRPTRSPPPAAAGDPPPTRSSRPRARSPRASARRPRPPIPSSIGGMLYLRLDSQWQQGLPPSQWLLTSPNLIDLYVDVRPNDRVRAFVLGRAQVNPLVPEAVQSVGATGRSSPRRWCSTRPGSASTSSGPSSSPSASSR